jgi:predicted helicase
MRWHLLKSLIKLYLDLHGNSRKTAPDGSSDQNVFDIMQGVSINLFVKKKKKLTNYQKFSIMIYLEKRI